MKNKNLITASLLLVPAFCLGSGRAPSAGRPADLRDALRDSTPLEELKAQGANEAAAIPQAAKGYAQPGGKAVKPGAPAAIGNVPGLTRTGDIPLPSFGPDPAGWFIAPVGYTEGGAFTAPVEKPEWAVAQAKVRPAAGPGTLRVMSWNVSRGQKLDKLIIAIKKANPDVLLLCEADMYGKLTGGRVAAREIAAALGYSYYAAAEFGELRSDRMGSSGNAIISRYPLSGGKYFALPVMKERGGYDWASDGTQPRTGQRNSISARIEVPGSAKKITLVSMHTENKANARVRLDQFKLLAKELVTPGEPAILAGDLNTVSMGEGGDFRNFLKGTSFFDCSNGDDRPTFSVAVLVNLRIDWVLLQYGAGGTLSFKSYDVIGKDGASDHSPVITEFKVN